MSAVVPADSDLLCEGCGYIVSGLPEVGNCPECGRAIADSAGNDRKLTAFEGSPSLGAFLRTALFVVIRPARFFRSVSTGRSNDRATFWFAQAHRFVAATLLALAICGLIMIDRRLIRSLQRSYPSFDWPDEPVVFSMMMKVCAILTFLLMIAFSRVATHIAARIATHRGIRLSHRVMSRVLAFHSVNWAWAALVIDLAVGGPLSFQVTPMALIFYVLVAAAAVLLTGGRLPVLLSVLMTLAMTIVVALYFNEFGGPYFDPIADPPRDWQIYYSIIGGTTLVGMAWLAISAWIAIRNTMFANDRALPAAPIQSSASAA